MQTTALSTEELARTFLVKAESIRSAYCRNGHYQNLKPRKLPNGRLLWPAADVARILAGEAR